MNSNETSPSTSGDSTELTGAGSLIVDGEIDVDALNALVTDFIALDAEQQRERHQGNSGQRRVDG